MLTTCDELVRIAQADERAVACPVCGATRFSVLMTPKQIDAERHWLRKF